jgi:hypothetical protein
MVELREVLEDMERVDVHGNPVPFEIKFVTADERRKTGGDIKHFGKAVMLTNKKRVNASSNHFQHQASAQESQPLDQRHQKHSTGWAKRPNSKSTHSSYHPFQWAKSRTKHPWLKNSTKYRLEHPLKVLQ